MSKTSYASACLSLCVTIFGVTQTANAAGVAWVNNNVNGSISIAAAAAGCPVSELWIPAQTIEPPDPGVFSISVGGACNPAQSAGGQLTIAQWDPSYFTGQWESSAQGNGISSAAQIETQSMGFTVSDPNGIDAYLGLQWSSSPNQTNKTGAYIGVYNYNGGILGTPNLSATGVSGSADTTVHLTPGDYYLRWFSSVSNYPYDNSVQSSSSIVNFHAMSVVPVPAAAWLFGGALTALGWVRRRQTTA